MESVTICGATIKARRTAGYKCGPFDTHVAWGFAGVTFGELMITSYGITEELAFIWDNTRPVTPGALRGPQLADMPHVQRAIAKRTPDITGQGPAISSGHRVA